MILDQIVEDRKIRLKEQKERISLSEMRRMAEEAEPEMRRMAGEADPEMRRMAGEVEPEMRRMAGEADPVGAGFYEALAKPGISVIGEFKKASPSLGKIESRIDLTERIDEYNAAVDAISCLTEQDHFFGCVKDFEEIRAMSPLPMLRKDFMIDEYQFYEAKAIGANAVLLIAAILDDPQLSSFCELAGELGMDALFEAHSEREMDRALNCGAGIVGVNNRDLTDFTIRLETTERLSRMVPEDRVFVAESGITKDEDIEFLARCGVDALLIGRAFMESENPKELADHWKSVYNNAVHM